MKSLDLIMKKIYMDSNFEKKNPIPVIILLGGKGSRFSKIEQFPKQLVRLNKNSLLASILLYYRKYKLNYFIFPLGYKKKYFINFFNNKKNIKKYNLNILKNKKNELKNYCINIKIFNAREKSSKLERIYKSTNYFKNKNFMVTYGDGLANINFDKQLSFFKKKQEKNVVTTFKIKSQYGHVKASKKKEVLSFQEKPYLHLPINIGYYIFNKVDFLKYFNKKDELEGNFLKKLIKKKLLYTFHHNGFFFNIDNKKDLEQVKIKHKEI